MAIDSMNSTEMLHERFLHQQNLVAVVRIFSTDEAVSHRFRLNGR